ncbi:hypothetical protein H2198_000014 [Neophaeococcomyces mojaviensis]|uniref:Uncharacterized protein n=1 Tax=Neophaeococcomyces mojaviensis TaxID=3383035 RepID=A0ACC3ALG0_9EURO|nr:hypothetical protein H2198_000014 [Knufia sp. JES_112]
MAVQLVRSVTSILSETPNRRHEFQIINPPNDFTPPRDPELFFTLNAQPSTNLGSTENVWTGNTDFTAPMLCKRMRHPFVLAEVTIRARFEFPHDQAGIVVFMQPLPRQDRSNHTSRRRSFYLSSGMKRARVALELLHDNLAITTFIGKPRHPLEKRSSAPFLPDNDLTDDGDRNDAQIRLKLERVGSSLWVWYRASSEDDAEENKYAPSPAEVSRQWKKCDEIAGFFSSSLRKTAVFVGCYASRPSNLDIAGTNSRLMTEFYDLDIL